MRKWFLRTAFLFPQFPQNPHIPPVEKPSLLPLNSLKTLLSLLSLSGMKVSTHHLVPFSRFSNVSSFGSCFYTMFLPSVNVCRRESGVRFRAALKAFLPPARASQAGLKKSPPFASLQVVFFLPSPCMGNHAQC